MGARNLEDDWPLFAIALTFADVVLRVAREDDLAPLASILPDDAEQDPASPMLHGLSLAENRRQILVQSYWRSLGTWSPEEWSIWFRVERGGRVVGVQCLEGRHFQSLRTVDSWSWLASDARGQGTGTSMRTAVLCLAFDHLGARAAISSASEENAASLAVSRSLGYQDNGVSTSLSPSGPCTLRHMILRRETWDGKGRGDDIRVSGLESCRPWFGAESS